MKKLGLFLIGCFVVTTGLAAESASPALKTVKITSKQASKMTMESGNFDSVGEEVQYIDLINNRYRNETKNTTHMGQMETTMKQVQFSDGKRLYTINPLKPTEATYSDLKSGHLPWQTSTAMLKSTGDATIAGHPCKIYDQGLQKLCIWNEIPLKKETHTPPSSRAQVSTTSEAIQVEENVALDDSFFQLPPGVKAISMEEKMAESKRQLDAFKSSMDKKKATSSK